MGNRLGITFLAAMLALMLGSPAQGASFSCPTTPLQIVTQEAPDIPGGSIIVRNWTVEPISGPEACTLRFSFDIPDGAIPVCSLKISEDGTPVLDPVRGQPRRGADGLLLAVGFPAPCSILPIQTIDSERTFTQRRSAGGMTFAKKLRVVREPIPTRQALDSGWLRHPVDAETLNLFSVLDSSGKVVLMQLWSPGDAWWLYEETAERKAWRIVR